MMIHVIMEVDTALDLLIHVPLEETKPDQTMFSTYRVGGLRGNCQRHTELYKLTARTNDSERLSQRIWQMFWVYFHGP